MNNSTEQKRENPIPRIKVSGEKAAETIKNLEEGLYLIGITDGLDDNKLIQIADAIRANDEAKIILILSVTGIKKLPDFDVNKGGVFANCTNLYGIALPDSYDADLSILDFDNCSFLQHILVGKNNSIYSSYKSVLYSDNGKTLYMCPQGKKSIEIPETVTKILEYAFAGCYKLSEITYSGTIAQWFSISKEENWDEWLTLHAIHCSDADIIFKNEEKDEKAVEVDSSANENYEDTNVILEEFKDWLIESDDMGLNSARDYKSHINSIIRLTDSEKEKGWFEKNILLSEPNRKKSLEECMSLLEKKNVRSSWKTAIRKLATCFEADWVSSPKEIEEIKKSKKNNPKIDFGISDDFIVEIRTNRDLWKRKFRNSILSQARPPYPFGPEEGGFQFHPRILNKIFGGRETDDNELIRWAHEDIDEMVIHVGDEDCYTGNYYFRDVEAMALLTDDSFKVRLNDGTIKFLYTDTPSGRKEIQRNRGKGWGDLSIEHKVSQKAFFRANWEELPAFTKLSNLCAQYLSANQESGYTVKDDYKWYNDFCSIYKTELRSLKNGLVADLNRMRMEYELMDRAINSSLGGHEEVLEEDLQSL